MEQYEGRFVKKTQKTKARLYEPTPLARFVTERLREMKMRQSEFCRLNQFDQGMLSKIQNSAATNLSLETVLKLAIGLSVPPEKICGLIGRLELHDLVTGAYSTNFQLR